MAVRGGERLLWRSRNTREVRHQHLLFAHPASLPVSNRNFLLCWNRNFSLCCDKVRSCTRRIQPFPLNSLKAMAGVEGFEPPTLGLENRGKSPGRRFKSLILRALLSR